MIPNNPCVTNNTLCRHTLCKQINNSCRNTYRTKNFENKQMQGKVSHTNTNKHSAKHKHNRTTLLYRYVCKRLICRLTTKNQTR